MPADSKNRNRVGNTQYAETQLRMPTEETSSTHQGIRIRPAKAADRKAVMRLRNAGIVAGDFPEEEPPPPHKDADGPLDAEHTPEGYWIAELPIPGEDVPRIVGTIGLRPLDNHVAEARRLYVEPEFRGRGIGIRLLQQLVETCRELGYLKVVLDVGDGSTKAVKLFRQLGFQLARERSYQGRTLLDFYLDIYRDTPR